MKFSADAQYPFVEVLTNVFFQHSMFVWDKFVTNTMYMQQRYMYNDKS